MLHAVIMAGGSGTRFWPKSRRNRPKQLLQLYGDATMLQQTVEPDRAPGPARADPDHHRGRPGRGRPRAAARAARRRTSWPSPARATPPPCVGLAADDRRQGDPDGTMIVMPADHVIEPGRDVPARPSARRSRSSTPTRPPSSPSASSRPGPRPATATSSAASRSGDPRRDRRCTASPSSARSPTAPPPSGSSPTGRFAWNSGIFVWRARAILDALAHAPPRPRRGPRPGRPRRSARPRRPTTIAREYPAMEKVPIDKAVMEKADNVRVLEVVYDWNDVGDWRALTAPRRPRRPGQHDPGARHRRRDHRTRSSSPTTAA